MNKKRLTIVLATLVLSLGLVTITLVAASDAQAVSRTNSVPEEGFNEDDSPDTPTPPREENSPAALADYADQDATGNETGATATVHGGTILLDQAPNQDNGFFTDVDCGLCTFGVQVLAENFVLNTTATINQIIMWSGYFTDDVPIATDDFTVIFHVDAGGLPSTTLSTETSVPSSRVQTGVVLYGVHEWKHTLALANPITLGPGTYWVEIYNDTTGSITNFFWETGDPDTVGNGLDGTAVAYEAPGSTWVSSSGSNFAVQLVSAADLEIVKTAHPRLVLPGVPLTYTLAFSNVGVLAASNVLITDVVPAMLTNPTFVGSSGANVTPIAGSTFAWQVEDLDPNEGGVITITGVVSTGLSSIDILTNTAIITSPDEGGNIGNNSSSADVVVAAGAMPLLYGTATGRAGGGFGESSLYLIDQTTGAAFLIGPTDFDNVTGLAFLDDGRLVGSARGDDLISGGITPTAILVEIDPFTGAGTLIGVIGDVYSSCGRMPDITYDQATDTLYGYGDYCDNNSDEGLYTVDPLTGAGTFVGSSGYTGGGNGMAIDPASGIIYATPFDDNSLVTLDPATGAGTEVPGSAGNVPDRVNALDFDPGAGGLYGSWNTGSGATLVTIDTLSGTTTSIGPSVSGLDAIAFASSEIAVVPPGLSSTQKVDGVVVQALTIRNTGSAHLIWVFIEALTSPILNGYTTPAVVNVAPERDSPNLNVPLRVTDSPLAGQSISLGDGPGLLYAPSEADDPGWRYKVAALTGGTVDYFDARVDTPALALLEQYDAALTWTNQAYADNVAFGNVLADYVDGGGRVILSAFTTFTSGNYLSGTIMTAGYAPVNSPTGDNHYALSRYAGDGTTFLHDWVTTYECSYRDMLALQGDGLQDGSYQDGEIAVSYRPDFNVIYINGLDAAPLDGSGDYPIIVANALLDRSGCGVPWASTSLVNGTTAPGSSADVAVTFDSTGMAHGVYTGTLCIRNNDPATLFTTVPLTMTVVPPVYLPIIMR